MDQVVHAHWRHVYRWDLDKTYLDTRFETLSELVKIPFERAEDKVNVPGSATLLGELGRPQPDGSNSYIAIVSGSPRQMREVLEEKLRLDGVHWQEFHLKPQLRNLRQGRLRALREQVGYKLPLLLESRCRLDPDLAETLFGDDAEVDALVYSLYADLLSGRCGLKLADQVLAEVGATMEARRSCEQSLGHLEGQRKAGSDPVETIFIYLDRGSPPALFAPFGPKLVPVFNYYQAALVLFARGRIDAGSVLRITAAFLAADQCSPQELANLFQDIVRRGHLPYDLMEQLALAVHDQKEGLASAQVLWASAQRMLDLAELNSDARVSPSDSLDYLELLARLKTARGL